MINMILPTLSKDLEKAKYWRDQNVSKHNKMIQTLRKYMKDQAVANMIEKFWPGATRKITYSRKITYYPHDLTYSMYHKILEHLSKKDFCSLLKGE